MKRILSIALIALITMATVFASPALNGRFGVKYTYDYESGSLVDGNRNYVYLTDSNDLWSLEIQTFGVSDGRAVLGDGYGFKGYATVNISEGLKTIDIDLPVSLSATFGTTDIYANYVYSDPKSVVDSYWDMKIVETSNSPFAITAGYNGWTATVATGIESGKEAIGIDVTGTIIDGIDVQAAYTTENEGQVQASAMINIGKLAKLDFTAKVSGFGYFDFSDSDKNVYLGAINLGYKKVSGYIEYRNVARKGENGVWAGATYKLNNVFSVGAGVSASDFQAFGDTLGYNVNASVSIAGVKTYLEISNKNITTYTQFYF